MKQYFFFVRSLRASSFPVCPLQTAHAVAPKLATRIRHLIWMSWVCTSLVLLCIPDTSLSQTPILCGQTITNSISAPGEVDQYTFGGSAGETLALAFSGGNDCTGSSIDAKVADLYNPSGQIIARLQGCSVLSSNVALPASGTYTILVHDDNYANTGSYALSINSFTGGGCGSTDIVCGQTLTSSISQSSEMDAYRYVGNAGETLALAFSGGNDCTGSSIDAKVADLYNPSGQIIARLQGCSVLSSNVALPASGTYTILVHDDNYANTGSYRLSLNVLGGCFRLTVGSTTVRTQSVGCLPLQVFPGSPAVEISFTVQAPTGYLSDVTLDTGTRFTNATVTAGPDSHWFIKLQTSSTNAVVGEEVVGSLCFTAVSTDSAFVPISVNNLTVTNRDGSLPGTTAAGSRAVVIADRPLLEAWLGPNRQRMVTTYGKANTMYEISQATNVTTSSPWTPGWTNTVPASLSFTSPVLGSLSNASILYLRANEK